MERQLKRGIFAYDETAIYATNNFSCGRAELDDFLKNKMARQQANNTLRAKVILSDDPVPEIMGYYTLSGGSMEKTGFSSALRRTIPYSTAPCILLGRLAVDTRLQGQGIGSILVAHAAKTVYETAQDVGVFALFTHPKDEQAAKFYADLGFTKQNTTDGSLVYFYPVKTIATLLTQFPF